MMRSTERFTRDKAALIINAAQKRFGLYGVEKTSMREISNDLNISKASLYYYFPDKESLYTRVIKKEQAEFLKILEEDIETISNPAECLRKYAMTRLSYFRSLLNLSRIRLASLSGLKPKISNSLVNFREEEKKIVLKVLEKGKIEGIFEIDDTYKTATLFLDLLRGLRSAFMTDKDLLVIEESEYRLLSDKVADITEIFIKGLMYRE
jgi:TetR/AcrR family transcriptional regulator